MRHAQEQLEDSYYEDKYQEEERETLTEYRARMNLKTALDAKAQIHTKAKSNAKPISGERKETNRDKKNN